MGFPLSDAEHARIKAMIDGQPEIVVAAAIRSEGIVVMVERPGRHGNCINVMHWRGMAHLDQGFVTNRGRFVDRAEAGQLVVAAGQGSPRTNCNDRLFSEDLWNDWDVTPTTPIHPEDVFATPQAHGLADGERSDVRSPVKQPPAPPTNMDTSGQSGGEG